MAISETPTKCPKKNTKSFPKKRLTAHVENQGIDLRPWSETGTTQQIHRSLEHLQSPDKKIDTSNSVEPSDGVSSDRRTSNQTCFLILAFFQNNFKNLAVFRNCVAISSNMFYLHIFIVFSDASPISCKRDQFFSYDGLTCLMARLLPWNSQTLSWHSTLSFGITRQAKIEILAGVFSPTHFQKNMSQIRSSPHIRGKNNIMFQTTKEKILGLVWWEGGSPPYGAFGTASQSVKFPNDLCTWETNHT